MSGMAHAGPRRRCQSCRLRRTPRGCWTQATFGPTTDLITQVQRTGFDAWITQQIATPATLALPRVDAAIADLPAGQVPLNNLFIEAWWHNVVTAPDQLRQRVAFALSEIMVVSAETAGLTRQPVGLASYQDVLAQDAFANFRQLLQDVTLNPAMGQFLDMEHNDKPDPSRNTEPNENYGREVMQLFTIGRYELNSDGSLILDRATGQPIPAYDQDTVEAFSRAFTGWYWAQDGTPRWNYAPANYRAPMMSFADHHDTNPKTFFGNVTTPAGQSPQQDLAAALDLLFKHPNTGPFIARQLVQRLVTSNPSPAYIGRVAAVFANNGKKVRGDMGAVVRAILLDPEARNVMPLPNTPSGHQREPLVRLANVLRAFNASASSGQYVVGNQTANFGQSPLDAPSVFNFFSPDFRLPGPIAEAGLISPEFQITTAATAISSANRLRTAVYQQPSDSNPDALVLDLSAQTALASNPPALLDSLNLLLMSGQMSNDMRNIVFNAVNAISPNNPLERAQTAVHLIVTSPEFVIEK